MTAAQRKLLQHIATTLETIKTDLEEAARHDAATVLHLLHRPDNSLEQLINLTKEIANDGR